MAYETGTTILAFGVWELVSDNTVKPIHELALHELALLYNYIKLFCQVQIVSHARLLGFHIYDIVFARRNNQRKDFHYLNSI